jgi:transcriptional regulator with XRE-family HTH domain
MKFVEPAKIGALLREWRSRRRVSQLDLALDAGISPRHLSFIETGRARPSREMVLQLAEQLAVPLRERNVLLTAAGFAAVFPQHQLSDDALQTARQTVEMILHAHAPNPALAIDRHWNVAAANATVGVLLQNVRAAQGDGPLNVLRLSLHPEGLASRILNYDEWRAHLFERLRRQIELTADETLIALEAELKQYPAPPNPRPGEPANALGGIAVPLRLQSEFGELSFLSTTTVFGTPVDVTLAELAIESFFPADASTRELLAQLSTR